MSNSALYPFVLFKLAALTHFAFPYIQYTALFLSQRTLLNHIRINHNSRNHQYNSLLGYHILCSYGFVNISFREVVLETRCNASSVLYAKGGLY